MKVHDIISRAVKPLVVGMTAAEVDDFFRRAGLEHLPVVTEDDEYLGIAEAIDVDEAPEGWTMSKDFLIELEGLSADDSIYLAAKNINKEDVSMLPVIDEGTLIGLVRRADVLRGLVHLLATDRSGAVLIIEVQSEDYSLGQMIYLVEQNDAKVLSIVSEWDRTETGSVLITVKLNVADASRIRAVLSHYGYRVVSGSDEASSDEMQSRIEELMRYLEV